MIKAVIFDLDNTLLDFMFLKRASCEAAISAMIDAGLNIPMKKGMKTLFEIYDKIGIENKKIFQRFLKQVLGQIDFKILSAGIVAYRRVKEGYLNPYPGVISTLIYLKKKGIKTAILTDAPRMRAWTRLAALRIADFFDSVVTYEDTNQYKPHPKGFEIVMKKLKVNPEHALMVGDWPQRDIKGAKRMGMKTAYAKYGSTNPDYAIKADYVLKDIRGLIKIIEADYPEKRNLKK